MTTTGPFLIIHDPIDARCFAIQGRVVFDSENYFTTLIARRLRHREHAEVFLAALEKHYATSTQIAPQGTQEGREGASHPTAYPEEQGPG